MITQSTNAGQSLLSFWRFLLLYFLLSSHIIAFGELQMSLFSWSFNYFSLFLYEIQSLVETHIFNFDPQRTRVGKPQSVFVSSFVLLGKRNPRGAFYLDDTLCSRGEHLKAANGGVECICYHMLSAPLYSRLKLRYLYRFFTTMASQKELGIPESFEEVS